MYMVDEKGKGHNLQFAVENWWITDSPAFTVFKMNNAS